jgi:hypothetical protein
MILMKGGKLIKECSVFISGKSDSKVIYYQTSGDSENVPGLKHVCIHGREWEYLA